MEASRTDHFSAAFIFTEEDARKLDAALVQFAQHVRYSIKCRDGIERQLKDVEELCSYENSPSRAIETLEIEASGVGSECSARIALANRDVLSIVIAIRGPEPRLLAFNDVLNDRLIAMRPWYSRLARTDFVSVLGAFLLAFVIGVVSAVAFGLVAVGRPVPTAESDPRREFIGSLVGLGLVAFPFALGFVLNRFRRRLFPVGTFALGQGARRHNQQETLRWVVGVGFLVSTVSGLVIWLLSRALG